MLDYEKDLPILMAALDYLETDQEKLGMINAILGMLEFS